MVVARRGRPDAREAERRLLVGYHRDGSTVLLVDETESDALADRVPGDASIFVESRS